MDFKISGKPAEDPGEQPASGEKGKQSMQLIILLLLVAGFGYVYFFTGVIKPQQEPPKTEPPPQVVKKPLPPRDQTAAAPATPAAPAAPAAPAKPAPAKPEPAKQAAAPAPAVPPPPAKKEEAKKAEPAKQDAKKQPAAEKKEQKQVVAKADTAKPQPAAKPAEKPKAAAAPAAKPAKAAAKEKKQTEGPWTLVAGNYLLEDAMATDMARVRKAGLEASIQPGPRRKTMMNRLLLGEYPDRETAQAELNKLKRTTSDAFMIRQDGKEVVYAGSYLLESRVESERERLAAAGFRLTLKRQEVPIPSKNLVAGTFKDRKAAEAALKKLSDAGLKAKLVPAP